MDPSEDTAVQDFLEILEEHRKNCERQGKYVEAEIAKNRLDELKLHEENRRRVRVHDKYYIMTPRHLTGSIAKCSFYITGSHAVSSNRRASRSRRGPYARVPAVQSHLGQKDDGV